MAISLSVASHIWTMNAGSRERTESMSSRTLSLTWIAKIFPFSRTASAISSMYPKGMSEMLGRPTPSATARSSSTSSGSNSEETGRPRMTASLLCWRSILLPFTPPSLKSMNPADPNAAESRSKRTMFSLSSSSDICDR